MASETDFLNDALGQIGAQRIDGIDDGSSNANQCLTFYAPLRRAMLRAHHWNFAEDRAILVQDVAAPKFEFAYAYSLAADVLKVKEYNGTNLTNIPQGVYERWVITRFKIEGRKLFTNDSVVALVYVKDVTDPNLWDPLFYQAASAWLASKLASAIQKDAKMSMTLLNQATNMLLPLAVAVDGQEMTVEPFISDSLTRGR